MAMIKGNRRPQAGASIASFPLSARPPAREHASIAAPVASYTPRRPGNLKNKDFRPQKTLVITIDHLLAAAGMAVAIGSLAFAAFMVAQNSHGTRLESSDELLLNHLARTRFPIAQIPFGTLDNLSIDYNSTGSIPRSEARPGMHRPRARLNKAKGPTAGHQLSENYILSFIYKNMALVRSKQGLYAAKPGTPLPGAGHVRSIEKRGQKWVLVTERTVISGTN